MNTRNTVNGAERIIFDTAKLEKAIKRLSMLCNDPGAQIIWELMDYEGLPYIDLLIKTGMDQDDLKEQLGEMVDAGVLIRKHPYYQLEYHLNRPKLDRVVRLARVLAA